MPAAEKETNFGAAPTSFVGRRADLDALSRLFERERLVTVSGPPGVGKTRLAAAPRR